MREVHRDLKWCGLMVVIAASLAARAASGEMTSERPAAIVVFPKVIADGKHDTVIQITNATNMANSAHCFYLNGAASGWQAIDFIIFLTAQQPTSWVVSQGRVDTQFGIFIPPTPLGFRGELLCVEIDASYYPIGINGLMGEATLTDPITSDVAKYNALGFPALLSTTDQVLCLGGAAPSALCPDGAEYDGCPAAWRLDHVAEGAEDPLLGTGSAVRTDLTVVPCTQDFDTQTPATVPIYFRVTNEFENVLSAVTTVTCWADTPLEAISWLFKISIIGTTYVQTTMQPVPSSPSGFMVVAQEFRGFPFWTTASAAVNAHAQGERTTPDVITLPLVGP